MEPTDSETEPPENRGMSENRRQNRQEPGEAGSEAKRGQERAHGAAPASQMCKLRSHFTGHLGVNLQRGSGGKLGT